LDLLAGPDVRPAPLFSIRGAPPSAATVILGDAAGDAEVALSGEGSGALSDARLADRVAGEVAAGRFLWARGMGWLGWNGRVWSEVSDERVFEAVRRYFLTWHTNAARRGVSVAVLKALSGLLGRAKIGNVAQLVRGIVEVDPADFDRHPDLLNVANGVIDLRTGELSPHDPNLLLTKLSPVTYRSGARHPDWDAALCALHADVADHLQVRFGQAISGHKTSDDRLPVLTGSGANGKSSIVGPIARVLGDHAVTVSERLLIANPGDHPTELMQLRGVRLSLIEEMPEGKYVSVKRLKDVLGTDKITARPIRGNNVTWTATHSLFLTSNYLPKIAETDHGTWRRLICIKFPFTFLEPGTESTSSTDRPGDPHLRERLLQGDDGRAEAVLAWVVEGARQWYAAGRIMPAVPAAVVADTDAWRASADQVFAYVRDRLVLDTAGCVVSVELYADFSEWQSTHGRQPWGDQLFIERLLSSRELQSAGVEKTRSRRRKGLSRPADHRFVPLPEGKLQTVLGFRFADDAVSDGVETSLPLTSGNTPVDRGGQGAKVNPHVLHRVGVNQTPLPTPVQDGYTQVIHTGGQHPETCHCAVCDWFAGAIA